MPSDTPARRRIWLWLLPPSAVVFIGLGTCLAFRGRLDPRTAEHSIEVDRIQRSFYLHVPPGDPQNRPRPLVIVLHGGGGRARNMEAFTGFSAVADREGFLVAYPDGVHHNWYDGREFESSEAHRTHRDDAKFVAAMIETIAVNYPIDRRRVYATGISNGGFFSNYLGAQMAGTFAAIAPVVGGIADPFYTRFAPSLPVAVLILQGTADPIVPYEGGEVWGGRGRLIPTDAAAQMWVGANGCTAAPATDALADRDTGDGCHAERTRWAACHGGVDVVLVKLIGGGHTWPGGSQYLPVSVIGPVCRDFDATEMIWEFFKTHSRP